MDAGEELDDDRPDGAAADARRVPTPVGTAQIMVHPAHGRPGGSPATLVLGHGAGGGTGTVDLLAVTRAAVAAGWRVVLVEQPWRLAGRRVAAPANQLDVAWIAVIDALRGDQERQVRRRGGAAPGPGLLVVGGRSAGARVACRTARSTGADAALCLAFPLHPPGRPERSRAGELLGAGVPVLVVQGRRDAFGGPQAVLDSIAAPRADSTRIEVVAVDGDHGLKADPRAVCEAVVGWLDSLVARGG